MPVVATFKVEGLSELKNALLELPKATGKNVMRRVLKQRAQPIADSASSAAPANKQGEDDNIILRDSISVSTKLSKRQRRDAKDTKSYTEVYVGPSAKAFYAFMQEFGTSKFKPQPFMRPAWDSNKLTVLAGIKDDLWAEIKKASERLARKAAKAKA